MNTIDWQPSRPPRKRRGRIFILALLAIAVLGGGTALSYYVEALWFNSLGFGSVFWTTLNIQGTVFAVFTAATFFVLYGSLLALRPDKLGDLTGLEVSQQKLPLCLGARLPGVGVCEAIAAIFGNRRPKADPVPVVIQVGLKIVLNALQVIGCPGIIHPRLVPVRYLNADEYAGHDNDEVDRDGGPLLPFHMHDEPAQQHL